MKSPSFQNGGPRFVASWRLRNYCGSQWSLTNKKLWVFLKFVMSVFCNCFSTMVQWVLRSFFHIDKKHDLLKNRPLGRGLLGPPLAAPEPKEPLSRLRPGWGWGGAEAMMTKPWCSEVQSFFPGLGRWLNTPKWLETWADCRSDYAAEGDVMGR